MVPAPRKPTPVMMPCARRVGSMGVVAELCSRSARIIMIAEPEHTSVTVRSPAGLRTRKRSKPSSDPRPTDIRSRICQGSIATSLASVERRLALLQEGLETLVHVLARAQDAEHRGLERQSVGECQL